METFYYDRQNLLQVPSKDENLHIKNVEKKIYLFSS
jgi:hypothetical protein